MLETIHLNLGVTGYTLLELRELKISHEINAHSRLSLSAVLDGENKLAPVIDTTANPRYQITLSRGEDAGEIIFCGAVETIKVRHLSGVYYADIEALSNTCALDNVTLSRSFHDTEMTFDDLAKKIDDNVDFFADSTLTIDGFTMQYQETNWEFLKRMASRLHTGLVADYHTETPRLSFGIPEGTHRGTLEKYNFTIQKDIGRYLKSGIGLTEPDALTYFVQTETAFQIGDQVTFADNTLYVKSVTAQLVEGVLLYTCALTSLNALGCEEFFNDKITGLSLKGRVMEREQDKVKVHLEIDGGTNQDESIYLFPYTTMYTAEGNDAAGWYWMPEEGDIVFIHFPSPQEKDAVGINAYRLDFPEELTPDVKVLQTPNGKKIQFSEDEILIVSETEDIFIRLHDEDGITIGGGARDILIKTEGNITFEAKKDLVIQGNQSVLLEASGTSIKLDSNIKIEGETHVD